MRQQPWAAAAPTSCDVSLIFKWQTKWICITLNSNYYMFSPLPWRRLALGQCRQPGLDLFKLRWARAEATTRGRRFFCLFVETAQQMSCSCGFDCELICWLGPMIKETTTKKRCCPFIQRVAGYGWPISHNAVTRKSQMYRKQKFY